MLNSVSLLSPIRAKGKLTLQMNQQGLVDLGETGGYRLKFPHNEQLHEVVMVNTAGGLVGGDSLDVDFLLLENTKLLISTTGAEKIYDSKGLMSTINISLVAGDESELYWLPQETILYNGANFKRELNVKLHTKTHFIIAEMVVFGRLLSGEIITQALMQDKWNIWRDEKLIHAENLSFSGALHEKLNKAAIGNGARAMATILSHNVAVIDALREKSFENVEMAFSVKNNMLIARFLSSDPHKLRLSFAEILGMLMPHSLPRNW